MFQPILDAGVKDVGKFRDGFRAERFFDRVSAEGKRQAAGFRKPPLAEIGTELETLARVGELALVDDEADVGVAAGERVENLVERDDDVIEFLLRHAEI